MPLLSSRSDLLKGKRLYRDYIHEVIFVIRQSSMDELTRILNDVSDPSSENYGQHLSQHEVADLTNNEESRDAVVSYLHDIGASITSESLGWEYITAKAPIHVWEKMLNTEFFTFRQTHRDNRISEVVRAEKYFIPKSLDSHVESVFKTIQMPVIISGAPTLIIKQAEPLSHANLIADVITPLKIRNFYNMSVNTKGSEASTQAVFAALHQYFSPKNLVDFQTRFQLTPQNITNQVGNYSSDSQCVALVDNCVESNLDVQYITSTSPLSPTTYWYTDLDFSSWLVTVANTVNPPLMISISYGQDELSSSHSELDAFQTQAIKLGVMGVTIVVASGDDGANSYTVRKSTGHCGYSPLFPASCPYVVSVGATSVRLSL